MGSAHPTVVWDLGNVLITWDRALLYRRLIPDPDELAWFLDNVLTLEANAAIDRGAPLDTVVAELAQRHPAHRDLVLSFADRWVETLGPVLDESVAILGRLVENGVRCLALSNWGADTFELVRDRYDFLDWFDALVISGREGVVKPDPAIFELLCSRHAVDPSGAVFIDDSPTNIRAAESMGFDTVLFTDPAALRNALGARGLPVG